MVVEKLLMDVLIFIIIVKSVDNQSHTFNHVDMGVKFHSCTLGW